MGSKDSLERMPVPVWQPSPPDPVGCWNREVAVVGSQLLSQPPGNRHTLESDFFFFFKSAQDSCVVHNMEGESGKEHRRKEEPSGFTAGMLCLVQVCLAVQ